MLQLSGDQLGQVVGNNTIIRDTTDLMHRSRRSALQVALALALAVGVRHSRVTTLDPEERQNRRW